MDDFANFRDGVKVMNMEARYIYPAYLILSTPSTLFINPFFGPPIKKRIIKRRYRAAPTSTAIITRIRKLRVA